ncbi:MAG: monovalent cation:H+ antiporter-2, family [Archaeoglobaceae archaeon]|nr:monovalent cation:H+ antiporter-2, family [Archaeoglobaceae archaeon]
MEIYLFLSIFLGFSALIAYIFERIGFSRIAGYLIAGITLSFFFSENLKANSEILEFFSDVAITLLVFEIGREIGIERIRRMNLIPLIILSFEIFFSYFFALLFGTVLKMDFIEILILASIASFSSTAIVYRLLSESGLQDSAKREIMLVMVFEDIYAILILALLPNLKFGILEPVEILRLVVLSLVITAILITVCLTVVRKIFVQIVKPDEPGVAVILGSTFLFAIVSKYFGLSPALGAFAAGVALSAHPRNSELSEYLRPLREMFLIVFFVTLGTEAGMINHYNPLLLLAPIIVFFRFLAFTSANWLTTGKSLKDSLKIGFVASSVGEFGMVITYEATRLGLVSSELLTLSALSLILGALISSKLSKNADKYATKISSIVPAEMEVFIDKISENTSKILEGKANEIVNEIFFRILRNVLVLVMTTLIGVASIYVSDLLFPSISTYLAIAIFSVLILAIILVAINTRKHAEKLFSTLVVGNRLGPIFEEAIISITFFAIVLLSLNLALLVSGNFLVSMVNRIYGIDITLFFMTLVLVLLILVPLIGYLKVKKISL